MWQSVRHQILLLRHLRVALFEIHERPAQTLLLQRLK